MKIKPPPDRRKFANEWDEIGYLYDKLLFWLYQREDVGKARLMPNAWNAYFPRPTRTRRLCSARNVGRSSVKPKENFRRQSNTGRKKFA